MLVAVVKLQQCGSELAGALCNEVSEAGRTEESFSSDQHPARACRLLATIETEDAKKYRQAYKQLFRRYLPEG